MKKIVITSILDRNGKNAGSKAKNDDRDILVKNNFIPLDIVVPENKIKKLFFSKFGIRKIIKENAADEYVIQYPLYSMIVIGDIIKNIRITNKDAKIIILIHDVESLRQRKNDQTYANKEIRVFNQVDGIIVHNVSMKKYLEDSGVNVPMSEQNLFDYLNNVPLKKNSNYSGNVCFAGNLKKAEFLHKLQLKKIHLNVYGAPQPEPPYKENVYYKGSFDPDELPQYLEGNFGLVWDGESTVTNTGIFGEYTRFNSPHKTSLYLSTGIPVIVWSKAGIAPFIKENKLGIAIDRIDNLDKVLTQLTLGEYESIRNNVEKYSQRIRKGNNLLNALEKVEALL